MFSQRKDATAILYASWLQDTLSREANADNKRCRSAHLSEVFLAGPSVVVYSRQARMILFGALAES